MREYVTIHYAIDPAHTLCGKWIPYVNQNGYKRAELRHTLDPRYVTCKICLKGEYLRAATQHLIKSRHQDYCEYRAEDEEYWNESSLRRTFASAMRKLANNPNPKFSNLV